MDSLSTSIWQDIFGISNEIAFSTIVPALIAILIFLFGLFVKWFGDWNKNRKDTKQKREFIFSQVEVLINAVSGQIVSVNKFIEMLQLEKTQALEFDLKVSFNPKHIFQIGSNELFRILVLSYWRHKKERLGIFNSLIKQLDLIEGLKNQFKDSFDYTLKHKSEYEKIWNDNIKIIRELHDNWKIEFLRELKNPDHDDFLRGFNQLYLRNINTKDFKDMYVAVPNFIEPSLQLARIQLPNIYAQYILKFLLECKESIDNHKHLRKFKVEEFDKYLLQLKEIEIELGKFLEFYNYNYSKELN